MLRSHGDMLARRDARLGNVIQDENLIGMAVYELDGCGKVFFEDQDVVAEAELV